MPNRPTIESMLRQVRSGELTPEQAASELLQQESEAATHETTSRETPTTSPLAAKRSSNEPTESLDLLIQRLGAPPVDVVNHWCAEFRKQLARTSPAEVLSGESLGLTHFSLTAEGELLWRKTASFDPNEAKTQENVSSPEAIDAKIDEKIVNEQVDEFRTLLLGDQAAVSATADRTISVDTSSEAGESRLTATGVQANSFGENDLSSDQLDLSTPAENDTTPLSSPKNRLSHRNKVLVAVAVLGVFVGVGMAVPSLMRSGASPTSLAKSPLASSNPQKSVEPSEESSLETIDPDDASGLDLVRSEDVEDLQSIGSFDRAQDDPSGLNPSKPGANELAFEPVLAIPSAADLLSPADSELASVAKAANGDASDDMDAEGESGDVVEIDLNLSLGSEESTPASGEGPDELVQVTELSEGSLVKTHFVELPSAKFAGTSTTGSEPVLLTSQTTESMELKFPYSLPLEIRRENEKRWAIVDSRANQDVAQVEATPDGVFLGWTEAAKESSSVSLLHHGHLLTDRGKTIYLRPRVEAKPFRLAMEKHDVRPTWKLGQTIAPRVTRLEVGLKLPTGVQETWAEVVDPEKVRRAKGTVVLRLEDDENVALGIRFDLSVGKKLSCRIRYAGRLDSSQSWQPLSRSTLERFIDQLTLQAGLVDREETRLSNVYRESGSRGKRVIREKQKRNDALSEQIQGISERAAKLQQLVGAVEASALLQIRVWAQWPDREQPIFTCGDLSELASADQVSAE